MNFTTEIIHWYRENKRALPWRETTDPYRIWVSEIIHQQTRVGQGTSYYQRFLEVFPTIHQLASASEEDVLNVWQGLGYYSRARNMHAASKEIVSSYGGHFPVTYERLMALKGIGSYTAAAISSIAFGEPNPVVDGNVLRFFSRFFGVLSPIDHPTGKKEVLELAVKFLDQEAPGEYNQAIMEFGALQCKPGIPDCMGCPISESCYAHRQGLTKELPAKSKTVRQRTRYFHYLVISPSAENPAGSFYLNRRGANDIWKGLYDFPLVETRGVLSTSRLITTPDWKSVFGEQKPKICKKSKVYKHVLSHQVIQAWFYSIQALVIPTQEILLVPMEKLGNYPIPRLIERFLQDEHLL